MAKSLAGPGTQCSQQGCARASADLEQPCHAARSDISTIHTWDRAMSSVSGLFLSFSPDSKFPSFPSQSWGCLELKATFVIEDQETGVVRVAHSKGARRTLPKSLSGVWDSEIA